MKKTIAIVLSAIMCLLTVFALAACSGTPTETTDAVSESAATSDNAGSDDSNAAEQTQPEEQTSDTQTQEEQTDAPTSEEASAPTEYEEDSISLYVKSAADHTPISAASGRELGCKFTVPENALLTALVFESCPTWSVPNQSGFTVELYKWEDDYDTTVIAGELLHKESFTEWSDNAACEVDLTVDRENGLPSGTYLWVFRGDTDNIGIWAQDPSDECVYFDNGSESNAVGYESHIEILVAE